MTAAAAPSRYDITDHQRAEQARAQVFVGEWLAPIAARTDREAHFPREVASAMAAHGFMGATSGGQPGGQPAMDQVTFGLINEEFGAGCSSARTLLTVHHMMLASITRWGTNAQKREWLPALSKGEQLGAFALTEESSGSDPQRIATTATRTAGGYRLRGGKRWISFGQYASVFLCFAKLEGDGQAFLVSADMPGVRIAPVAHVLGTRGSMLAHIDFDCEVSEDRALGPPGFGLRGVAASALDLGRYSVAWGCVGILRACSEASAAHAAQRRSGEGALGEQQLVRRMLADGYANTEVARLACLQAGRLRDVNSPWALEQTFLAKYVASTLAMRTAGDAVQVHGAAGCGGEHGVERFFRDAKVMEIIEGNTELQQVVLGGYALRAAALRLEL